MLRRGATRDLGWKLISILLAFGLWFFVNAGERDTEAEFQVPLELRNIPSNLMIVSPRIDFVDLRVSGPRTLLSRIDQEHLSLPLDLSGVRPGPAVFRVMADSLNLPRGVSVVRMTPSEITVEFARVMRKKVPVHLSFSGKPPGDLRITDTKVAPEVVEIIGPAGEVKTVKAAETNPIDLSGASAGLLERDVTLEAAREYLSYSASLVHVQVRLEEPEKTRVFKGIPVVVRNDVYRTRLAPERVRVTVRGPESSIDSLELAHGAVYIDATDHGPGRYELTPAVDLPPDVELIKVEPDTLRLEVLREKRRADGG
jgi:YbbR domain-containing protein